MPRQRLWALIEATFAVVVWGATFVATKVALREAHPVTVVWLRFGMGVLILAGAVLLRRQFKWPQLSELPYLALTGFVGITLHQWLQSTGLVTARATTTSWIVATIPIFMALAGWWILKEKASLWQVLGILLAFVGVLLVVSRGDWRGLFSGEAFGVGDFLVLLSSPNWAFFSLLSRRGLKRYPAALMMLYIMSLGWLFSGVQFAFLGGWQELPTLSASAWSSIAILGIFGSGLAYIAWYDALQALSMSETGAFVYLEPFVTVLVAWLVLGEALSLAAFVGGITILAGVWLVNRFVPQSETK